jgi:hypothetical protein
MVFQVFFVLQLLVNIDEYLFCAALAQLCEAVKGDLVAVFRPEDIVALSEKGCKCGTQGDFQG